MKRIRLIRLNLSNFKGVTAFSLNLDGQSAVINGSNGVGKTTLFDAYNWLLFGKDGAGHSDSSFDVKPYNTENPIVSVTGELEVGVDGIVTLSRMLAEKTVRQRGTDETSIKNEYKFFIDGVPKTKTQYDKYIAELCPPDQFRMVSDPDYFAGKLAWSERRAILTQLFGSLDESQLLSSDDKWESLSTAANGKSVSDYRSVITGERKKVKAELDAIPDRIAEAELAVPETVGRFDPAEILTAEKDLQAARDNLQYALDGTSTARLRQKIAEAKTSLAEKRTAYIQGFSNDEARKKRAELEQKIHHLNADKTELVIYCDRERTAISDQNRTLEKLRQDYRKLSAVKWNSADGVCPSCKQTLPLEKISELREQFNADKAAKLEENISAGKKANQEKDSRETNLADAEKRIEDIDLELANVRYEFDNIVSQIITPPPFESTEDYRTISAEIQTLEAALDAERKRNSDTERTLRDEVQRCQDNLDRLRETAAAAGIRQRQNERIGELKQQGRELGKRAAELDRMLDVAASFEQYKLSAIEENINDRFKYAKFKLFDRQLNGGYSECCEVVVDNAPYNTNLNPGKKINAGLDIIGVISEAIGFAAPVWIDNSESYVSIMDIDAQVIQLRVDADAAELTVSIN